VNPQLQPGPADVLGCRVDVRSMAEVHTWIETVVEGRAGSGCRHLVTLNPEYVMLAQRNPEFRSQINNADVVLTDGVGVAWAVPILNPLYRRGMPIERVTGVDLTEWIGSHSGQPGWSVFLLGAGPGVAITAAAAIEHRTSGAAIAGSWDGGSAESKHDAESLRRIRELGARVVLVAYGAPGQVEWIARNQQALGEAGVVLAIGVGGAFDFVSGRVPRAPGWMRSVGLEWLYRLVREPWRARRMAVLPVFAGKVLLTRLRGR